MEYPLGPWATSESWVDTFWSSVVTEILGVPSKVVVSPLTPRIHWKLIHPDVQRFVGARVVLFVKKLVRPEFERMARYILRALRQLHGRSFDRSDVQELSRRLQTLWTAFCVALWKKYGILFVFKRPNIWVVGGAPFIESGSFESWLPIFSGVLREGEKIFGGAIDSRYGLWALLNSFGLTVRDIEDVGGDDVVRYFRALSEFRDAVTKFWRVGHRVVVRKRGEEESFDREDENSEEKEENEGSNGEEDGEEAFEEEAL